MFKIMNECFHAKCKTSLQIAAAWETSGNSWWFTNSNHIPFRFGCWPRKASRLEARTHEAEAEAKTHEAEAEAEATTHEAEARFFGLEAEARPQGLTSLIIRVSILETLVIRHVVMPDHRHMRTTHVTVIHRTREVHNQRILTISILETLAIRHIYSLYTWIICGYPRLEVE